MSEQTTDNTRPHCLSLSYGKDSLACLGRIKQLGYPLTHIVHAEIMATDTIPADLPPMVEFKDKADKWILDNFGIKPIRAHANHTYEQLFHRVNKIGKRAGHILGFPVLKGVWCNDRLKMRAIKNAEKLIPPDNVAYVGIAADEAERLERWQGRDNVILPLVELGWTEADCYKWCEEHDLLSPLYKNASRGGCWFCHYASIGELRTLYNEYPDLFKLLLQWEDDLNESYKDFPVRCCPTYKPNLDKQMVHKFRRRFELENQGLVPIGKGFKWAMLDTAESQMSLFNREDKKNE